MSTMEVIGEDLKVQVLALSHNAPNQVVSLLNEDVAIATEVVTEKPEMVEIEKQLFIQNRFIVKEKILVPKKTVNFPSYPMAGHTSLFSEGNDRLVEVSSQESSKMEIASQESTDSRMDISSQESSLSQMECSSQEADSLIKPIRDDCFQCKERQEQILESKGSYCKEKEDIEEATCSAEPFKGNGIPINDTEVLSTEALSSETCLGSVDGAQINQTIIPEDILKENLFQREYFETEEAENVVLKRKTDTSADEMRLRTEKSLLYREEAVAARETACSSRERAVKEREAAIVSQDRSFLMAVANDTPSPKRLKLIGVFECS